MALRCQIIGNTTRILSPKAPEEAWDCKYDAWNRLRQIKRKGQPFLVFDYDDLGRRITKRVYDRGDLQETRFYWYDDQWRVLEERVQRPGVPLTKTPPERLYVWGQRGLNDLVLRLCATPPATAPWTRSFTPCTTPTSTRSP